MHRKHTDSKNKNHCWNSGLRILTAISIPQTEDGINSKKKEKVIA